MKNQPQQATANSAPNAAGSTTVNRVSSPSSVAGGGGGEGGGGEGGGDWKGRRGQADRAEC
jgi:hypothetical protein